jgi:hypothetical protein
MRSKTVTDKWYCADQNVRAGPFTLRELGKRLVTQPNAAEALVWCNKFSDWKRAGDVGELKAYVIVPSPLSSHSPRVREVSPTNDRTKWLWEWKFQWWWVIVALPVVALVSVKIVVGNNDGRSEIDRLSRERRAMRKADKNKLQPLTK